jgi:hypothetical protein
VADVLVAARVPSAAADVDLVLRWALSQLLWPGAKDGSVEVLVRALDGVAATPPAAPPAAAEAAPARGWPRV